MVKHLFIELVILELVIFSWISANLTSFIFIYFIIYAFPFSVYYQMCIHHVCFPYFHVRLCFLFCRNWCFNFLIYISEKNRSLNYPKETCVVLWVRVFSLIGFKLCLLLWSCSRFCYWVNQCLGPNHLM